MSLDVNRMLDLAEQHARWFIEMVKPLLQTYMEHGYKHGWDDGWDVGFKKGKLDFLRKENRKCND